MSAAATTELTALPRSPSLPTFFDNLDSFAEAPEGVAKLRELILGLAVRGKLVEQGENDEQRRSYLKGLRKKEKSPLLKSDCESRNRFHLLTRTFIRFRTAGTVPKTPHASRCSTRTTRGSGPSSTS